MHSTATVAAPARPGMQWTASVAERAVASPAELRELLAELGAGECCLLTGSAPWAPTVSAAVAGLTLWWFPLEPAAGMWRALAERPAGDAGLAAYLAREHRLIEAAWSELPGGRPFRWRLARHLRAEEEVLFPAWLEHGDRPGWVRGLAVEHDLLRRPILNSRIHFRAYRRRLDSHADKEERIFYPALIASLGSEADALLRAAMLVTV